MSYTKTTWAFGDPITSEKMNNLESGVYNNDAALANKASASHKGTHSIGGTDVLSPADIGAMSASDIVNDTTTGGSLKALSAEQGKIINNNLSEHASDANIHVTTSDKSTWNAKQNALTFDTTPTASSINPVTSGGVKTALDAKVATSNIVNNLTSGGTAVPLSAEQGKTLKGLVDTNSASIEENSASISELTDSTVKFTAAQTLTTLQRYQARKNIGAAAEVGILDAYELQEAVRQGRANQILSVGDFFTVGRGGTDWLFQVAAFDYDVPIDSNYTHSIRLLMYPCFANVAFDAQEAIYYAAAELAAGTYWFINNRTNKYYSFTTTQAIPVGGQAVPVFGPPPDYTITKLSTYASQTSTTVLETVTATVSDTAPGSGTQLTPVNDDNRARWGNNNWMQSAIRQWLNSAATTGWWTAKNIYDRPQSSPTDGFLNGIDADLLACIGKVRLRTGLNPVDNAGVFGSSDNEELIFLPSRTEMGLGNSATAIYETPVAADGTAKTDVLPLFKSNADRIKYLAGVARSWWMRSPSPYASGAYNADYVYTDGSFGSYGALGGYGAVPACVIY